MAQRRIWSDAAIRLACDRLAAFGVRPTVAGLRAQAVRGDNARLGRVLREWRVGIVKH